MQQKYVKYVMLAIVVAFIVPQITLAAWYNPLSWNWDVFGMFFSSQSVQSHKSPATASNLTLSDINNATYTIDGIQAQFSDGKFHPERDSALSTDQGLNAIISSYALGDINGDGKGDAVVVTEYGMGVRDARTDALQIVLNVNGKPQVTNIAIPSHSGENLAIGFSVVSIDSSGLIKLTLDILPPSGDYYNPIITTREYRYVNGALVENQTAANLKTQSTNITVAGWKTYSNAQYGIQFQYPDATNNLQISSNATNITIGYGTWITFIQGYRYDPSTGELMTLQEVMNEDLSPEAAYDSNIVRGTTAVDGQTAITVTRDNKNIGTIKTVYMDLGGGDIFSAAEYKSNPAQDALFNQMLSTFILSAPQFSILNGNVYQNNLYHFQFQYPAKLNTQYASLAEPVAIVNQQGSPNIDANGCSPVMSGSGKASPGTTVTIGGKQFCLTVGGDVGAGQLNQTFDYTMYHNGLYITLQYLIQGSTCGGYMNSEDPNAADNATYRVCLQGNSETFLENSLQSSVATLTFTN